MKNIIFCGGDKRELVVMKALLEQGYRVQVYGCPEKLIPEGAVKTDSPEEAFPHADICILPQMPIKQEGRINSLCDEPVYLKKEELALLPRDTPILCGAASAYLRTEAAQCRIFEMAEDEELAVRLAPASAEGAVAEALQISGGLLAGSKALIIGFGRIGRELAWRLVGLGMDTVIINRGREKEQEAVDMGYTVADRSQLVSAALDSDYIFNTAPALILDEVVIGLMPRDTCILDLAAYPGGTDFAAAARRGIRAVHAGGLPGRYSSEYAGAEMAAYYPEFIAKLLNEEG